MPEVRLDHVGVLLDAELIGHGQEERVRLGEGFITRELFDEGVRFGRAAHAR